MALDSQNPSTNPRSLFLQYTSGSTSNPKGVMVTQGNIIANERWIQNACEHTEESTFVGWLPFYHDMGLIGNILQPLYLRVEISPDVANYLSAKPFALAPGDFALSGMDQRRSEFRL